MICAGVPGASLGDADVTAPPRLARPGEVLFVREVRRRQLLALPAARRQALCGAADVRWRSVRAPTTVSRGRKGRLERFGWQVMRAAAAAFGADDRRARRHLLRLLDRWAKGRALTRWRGDPVRVAYDVDRLLLPTIVGWWLVREHPDVPAEVRARVDGWLDGLVARSVAFRAGLSPDRRVARNNHALLGASVAAAWGALTDEPALLRRALAVHRAALATMRADGSLPLETARGARALWYQRHALSSLVVIDTIAAVQGLDAGAGLPPDRDLHRAVRFLLDAVADPRRVLSYALANVRPGPARNPYVQDLSFLRRRPTGRHYMAWAEIYLARFPTRTESRRLAATLAAHGPEVRPMIDEYGGGHLTCFFADPDRDPFSASSTRSRDSVPSGPDRESPRTSAPSGK